MSTSAEAQVHPFTPGPWEADEDGNVSSELGTQIARVLDVTDFPCLDPDDDDVDVVQAECAANARLIAAAPDMFDALRDVQTKAEWSVVVHSKRVLGHSAQLRTRRHRQGGRPHPVNRRGPNEGTPGLFLCPRCGAPALPRVKLAGGVELPARCTRCEWKAEPLNKGKYGEHN